MDHADGDTFLNPNFGRYGKLVCPPAIAYGEKGAGASVPPQRYPDI